MPSFQIHTKRWKELLSLSLQMQTSSFFGRAMNIPSARKELACTVSRPCCDEEPGGGGTYEQRALVEHSAFFIVKLRLLIRCTRKTNQVVTQSSLPRVTKGTITPRLMIFKASELANIPRTSTLIDYCTYLRPVKEVVCMMVGQYKTEWQIRSKLREPACIM